MLENGTYIAVFILTTRRHIRVGQLGCFDFKPGVYLYVGSAPTGSPCASETARQEDQAIDYLSTQAAMIGAMIVPGPRERECELAKELSDMYVLAVPGFGASDCRRGGHLFYAREL